MRYALVQSGVVVNVIMWDGETDLGVTGQLIQSDEAGIGDLWDGTQFTRPG